MQNDDPCILNTQQILSLDPLYDYEEILNTIQRDTKCTEQTYLRKQGNTTKCHYKAPWKEQPTSTLTRDNDKNITYNAARNDDHLNIHNPQMLAIC